MKTIEFNLGPLSLLVIPVLCDNFVYLLHNGTDAVLVDCGDAAPVFRELEARKLKLRNVLITHTHSDHVGGCRAVQERLGVLSTSPAVESGSFDVLGTTCHSIPAPGHKREHKLFHFPELQVCFTGDTLINGACGRILDGTAEQLFSSLQKIKALPDATRIFGGHDYLMDNLEFAQAVEPENTAVKERVALYSEDRAGAIFATLAEEKATNPFLRAATLEAFTELRARKDVF